MAWLPSHQELRDHPKARKAARLAGVSLPQMIGHLHLLWWWALDLAPDGNLSKYDALDLADAAMWDGDPEKFVTALRECGPGASLGFLEPNGRLHDWDEYGGKYGKRVDAARKAAAVRWQSDADADAMRTHSEGIASAMHAAEQPQSNRNAEERRVEKKERPASADAERREDVDSLCDVLVELVAATGARKPTVTKQWRDEARRLLDRDGVERGEAERVMRWALADDFWRSNVMSIPTFRKQYDRLKLQSQRHLCAANGKSQADDWLNTVGNLSRPLEEFLE